MPMRSPPVSRFPLPPHIDYIGIKQLIKLICSIGLILFILFIFITYIYTLYLSYHFYRAMHFSAKRGIEIACRPSVCLSVCP